MSYSPLLGLLVALPLLGAGGNAAGRHSAAVSYALSQTEAQSIRPATVMREAGIDAELLARVNAEPPAQAEPHCAELDKHQQLRGRVDPNIVRTAGSLLSLPMGAGRFVSISGHRYAFCLERHYHPPGFTRGPQGWHKGVTVYDTP